MQNDTVDSLLMTFMYFLATEQGSEEGTPAEFYSKWSNLFYDFDDMAEGKDYE